MLESTPGHVHTTTLAFEGRTVCVRTRVWLCVCPVSNTRVCAMTASKMTVAQLRAALVEKGLDGTGLKPALVARLESATSGSGGADAKGTSGETV